MKQNDIYKKIAKELDIPERKVKFAIDHFESCIRWFLSNPLYAGKFVHFDDFFTLRTYDHKIKKGLIRHYNRRPDGLKFRYWLAYYRKFYDRCFMKNEIEDTIKID